MARYYFKLVLLNTKIIIFGANNEIYGIIYFYPPKNYQQVMPKKTH